MQVDVRDTGSIPGLGRPLEKGMATHSSILAGEFHGYSPWYQKELDTTEQLMLSLFFSVGFSQDFFVIHISYSYRYLFLW